MNGVQSDGNQFALFVPGQLIMLVEPTNVDRIVREVEPTIIDRIVREAVLSALPRNSIVTTSHDLQNAELKLESILPFIFPPSEASPERPAVFAMVFMQNLPKEPAALLQLVAEVNTRIAASDGTVQVAEEVNTRIAAPNGAAQGAVQIHSVSPNWYCGSASGPPSRAPTYIGHGGPGGSPIPRPAAEQTDSPHYDFNVPSLTRNGPTSSVVIFDTVPTQEQLSSPQITTWVNAQRPHPIMKWLRSGTKPQITHAGDIPGSNFNDLSTGDRIFHNNYQMSDHGLFVAGIIHALAPAAQIHLVQVLNEYGVGTLASFLFGISHWLLTSKPDGPWVVNCSWTLTLPPLDPKSQAAFQLLLSWMFGGLNAKFAMPIVAAAGNEGANGLRPPAGYPAAIDHVIGVAALDADGNIADYSNLADDPPSAGLAVFGGTHEKGILGAYTANFPDTNPDPPTSSPEHPLNVPNDEGWAYWYGTSFATAIVSGLLASGIPEATIRNAAFSVSQ